MPFYTVEEVLNNEIHKARKPREPVTVEAGDEFREALDLMVENDFSQIPVEDQGRVAGVVTHESVYRALSVLKDEDIRDVSAGTVAEEPSEFVEPDEDIYELFGTFASDSYVLVGSPENLEAIVTQYDLSHFLRRRIRPFLLIGEIEHSLRSTFEEAYPDNLSEKVEETFDERADAEIRVPETVERFSFVHHRIFISVNWNDGLSKEFSEGKDFVDRILADVQEIRNALLHFRDDSRDLDMRKLELAHDCLTDSYW